MNIRKFIDRPVLVVIIFVSFTGLGIYAASDLSIDLFPEITFPTIVVSTVYESAGPEEVERNLTRVLEGHLSNISRLKKMTSTSSEGLSLIQLEFDWGAGLEEATNEMRDALEVAKESLPDEAKTPRIFKFDLSAIPILTFAMEGTRSAAELREIADDFVRPLFEQIDGVALVTVFGGREKAVRADISQNRLDAYGLTISSAASALAQQNIQTGGGKLDEAHRNYLIRTNGELRTVKEIAEAVIAYKGAENHPVALKDIARVYEGYLDADMIVKINGRDGVYVVIQKQSDANSVRAADNIYQRLPEINAALPRGVRLVVLEDESTFIRNSIANLGSSAVQGMCLTMIVLFLFLRNIRAALIIGASIPISIVLTLFVLYFAGITLNIMTLAGLILGVGLIVDSSIVILENIFQYRRRGADPCSAAVSGGKEVVAPIIASALTTICVFVPLILFKYQLGLLGVVLGDMMVTIVVTIAASLLVAIVLVPVLAARVFPVSTRAQKPLNSKFLAGLDNFFGGLIDRMDALYKKTLALALGRRKFVILGSAALFAASLAAFPLLSIGVFPDMIDDAVKLTLRLPVGSTMEKTAEVLSDLDRFIREEAAGYTSIYYTAGATTDSMMNAFSAHYGELIITLPPRDKRIDTSETIKAKLRARFAAYPGVVFNLEEDPISESEYPIDIAVKSDDFAKALRAAAAIESLIRAEIPEAVEISRDIADAMPEVRIVVDRKKAYALGLSTQNIGQEIRASINGLAASVFRKDGREYDIFFVLQDSDKSKIPDLNKIFVLSPSGLRVPVSGFAELQKGTGPVDIKRENQTRTVRVQSKLVPGAEALNVTQNIRARIEASLVLEDLRIEYGGAYADIQDFGGKLIVQLLIAVGLVFCVMAGQYESLKDPFINFFTIPLIFIGVIAIYLATGQTFNMFSAIGVIMLAGIVVNNGIVLVDYTNLLRSRGANVHAACIEAGANRLQPVLMTSLTTILATVPMAFFPGESSDMIQPIGLTVIGGLTVSTFITLYLIPVIYTLLNKDSAQKDSA
jgi:HAE1 family hydrophobic/amphiphilic exporter-1